MLIFAVSELIAFLYPLEDCCWFLRLVSQQMLFTDCVSITGESIDITLTVCDEIKLKGGVLLPLWIEQEPVYKWNRLIQLSDACCPDYHDGSGHRLDQI
ncbi:hypothetical protein SDC9_76890 [bioreactor metagenome]|uniref:Uncharacterized protein n=1 Tax=bioreactor metagenome TaxID=1076179 RepID=A0A644YNY6_9ZZZZ